MNVHDQVLADLTRAVRECVRADWLADKTLADANDAAERLVVAQAKAKSLGLDPVLVANPGRMVVARVDGVVDVVHRTAVTDEPAIVWPSSDAAVDELSWQAPEGMDSEVAEERIRLHCTKEPAWGGVMLDCSMQQLRQDLCHHFQPPMNGPELRDAI